MSISRPIIRFANSKKWNQNHRWLRDQWDLMPGDPKECRKHAARCAELAVAARTPQLKAAFLGLSKNWEKLAIQLEDAFAQLAESQDIRSRVQETVNEARQLRKA
jgi:hypothetical protein